MNVDLTLLKSKIRERNDWPCKGVVFQDLTPLLSDGEIFSYLMDNLFFHYRDTLVDKVVAVESKGFIFGSILANKLKSGFIPIRKQGKLPYRTLTQDYNLEYGSGTLEVHCDGICEGDKVLVLDDVLATGGTALATIKLMKRLKAQIVGCAFVLEIEKLQGKNLLEEFNVFSVIKL
jgi:adenine phosphoribosyltransferase